MSSRVSFPGLAWKSVRFYWRTQLSVLAGTVVAAAVLVGALLVGDSVRYSLRRFALLRLGRVVVAADARNRFFDDQLGVALADRLDAPVASLLKTKGIAVLDEAAGHRQLNRVQVLGIDKAFGALSQGGAITLDGETVALSRKSAAALEARVGDRITVRVGKPTLMPRDAPLASRKEEWVKGGSFRVGSIVEDEHLGRFSLDANQLAPYNVFVSREWLQTRLELAGRSNVLLVGSRDAGDGPTAEEATTALRHVWRMSHAGISVNAYPEQGILQLESDRIFLDPETAATGLDAEHEGRRGVGVLTYMVNGISSGADSAKTIPYSFAIACSPSGQRALSPVPDDMGDDEVIIGSWVADALGVDTGATVTVAYYELVGAGDFVERSREFTVHSILSMERLEPERALMPDFPGLTDVESCRDWDIGIPMEEEKLRDERNEAYWDTHGATPKLVVTLAAGREMWGNRFGDTSAVRFPGDAAAADGLCASLEKNMDPTGTGLFLLPVREQALRAVSQSLDLGEYFACMSVFLIVAALMLTGLLYVFTVQQRGTEMGTLLAIGMRPRDVRKLMLLEGGVLALFGSVVGAALGTFYTRAIIFGLGSYWQGVIAGAAVRYHAEPSTILSGAIGSTCCALGAMGIAIWHQARLPATVLLSEEHMAEPASGGRDGRRALWSGAACVAAAVGIIAYATTAQVGELAGPFFGAGALVLTAGILFMSVLLRRLDRRHDRLTLCRIGTRNASRRRGRSLTAVGLLACGSFMVLSVSAFKRDIAANAGESWSGTGGFELFAESTIPVPDPLETADGFAAFRLGRATALSGVSFVSLKVHDGDDASCFNLNRAQSPRLLAVDPGKLRRLRAFDAEGAQTSIWELLEAERGADGTIPAIAGDGGTLQYGLRKKADPLTGDTVSYRDERGNLFDVRLVGSLPVALSVFQGTLLVSTRDVLERFPSESGYRVFLADIPDGVDLSAACQALGRRMGRVGLEVTPCVERLAEFYSVESTYLGMFLVLGGMGLVLGTVGMGVVVLRNVLERRRELALLRCVGYTSRDVALVVMAEHWFLLVAGLAIGAIASLVGVWPNIASSGVDMPIGGIVGLLLGVLVFGIVWIGLTSRIALRGRLLDALRSE